VHRFQVPEMSCGHCVRAITAAVQARDPAARVEIDLADRKVAVSSTLAPAELAAAITAAGYANQPA